MPNELRFDGRVAIITGAGNGLGRAHALLLGSRGAKVVVNDLGGGAHGDGKSSAAADKVVAEIKALGGDAVANHDSVEDGDKIVQTALDAFGRVDIVINNAGILRDVSFAKMSQQDWDLIYKVHVLGAFKVTQAAWPYLRDHDYGRVIFTASAAGIYGNFGQANYSMAKLGLVGFGNTLAVEGRKKNVLVNTIAPIAGSRMTETVLPKELVDALKPEFVSPLVAYLCHESCEETGGLYEVGGGFVSKLRWQRTRGFSFKLSRPLSPEAVAKEWGAITDFSKSTSPADITASMAPVLENLGTAKGRGGNEFIDVDAALGHEFAPQTSSYDERDLALYALGVGAAHDPLDKGELQTVFELHREGFRSLPTFAVIPALNALFKAGQAPGMNYGFERILHGEQYTELKRPLPPRATLTHKARIKDIFDKGKNAVVVTEIKSYDETGQELFTNQLTTVVRGAGGFGGDRGPSGDAGAVPDRAPDAVVTEKTADNQALLYRLSGDWNPLHADPEFASNFGFKKPILHGLCTFGFAARHVIRSFSNGDPRFFKSIKARFTDSVFPGETLRTEMWKDGEGRVVFRCKAVERDVVVISGAVVELFKEIPSDKPAPRPAPAASAAPSAAAQVAAAGEAGSRDIFVAIKDHVERNPDLVGRVQTVFLFKLSDPGTSWTLDAKNGKGSVVEGASEKPDVTLELTDADFVGMATGKLDAQKLYFGGKLKISGNVMASQKLDFLKKIDPRQAAEAVARSRGAQAAEPAPTPSTELTSANIFAGIRHHIEAHPELVAQVQTVFQFTLTDPASGWYLDVKNGKGEVAQGLSPKPDVTLELSDADFLGMSTGKLDAQKLYFGGKLKISGNVMASQKLDFLKKIDPKATARAVAARPAPAAGPSAPAAPAASKEPRSPALFAALGERLAKSPALAGEVGAVIQFNVKSPDSQWVVDLKSGAGQIRKGAEKAATTTLQLDESDLEELLSGSASPRDLYQRGKLRVDGDVRAAHKLGVLRKPA